MKTLSKTEYAKRWLMSGKSLTYRQAIINWQFYSFRRFLDRNRDKLNIINIGEPGKYGKYIINND